MARLSLPLLAVVSIAASLMLLGVDTAPSQAFPAPKEDSKIRHPSLKGRIAHRSPVDLVLAPGGQWLVTANESSKSISLVDVSSGSVLDELDCGGRPASVALCLGGSKVLVSCSDSRQIHIVSVKQKRLELEHSIDVGFEPVGVAVGPEGRRAFVGLAASGEVVKLDLAAARVAQRVEVGKWPRYLALTPDGSRLAVACSGESKIVVLDAAKCEVLYDERLTGGINIGHMQCSQDGKYVYFPWMVYRSNPITTGNIRLGWVLASRIGRVRMDGSAYREAISLDVPRRAVADPHGLAISGDQQRLVVAASGTHELLVYGLPKLPFVGVGGPGDLIDRRLIRNRELFSRIDVGGRPMGLKLAADNKTAFVANYLHDSVQQVDIDSREVVREISLGEASPITQARRGMAIFYDGRRSLDQWYSCHSCHYNGGVNSKAMDTLNDGSNLTMKTVLPLYNVLETSPWTWHGWQNDLQDAMRKSFTKTMQGEPISDQDANAVLAFLGSLRPPPNPFRDPKGELSAAAKRGQQVFRSSKAGCANCHSGPYYTDGEIHDVGLGSEEDRYQGFNTPTLIGVYRKVRFLHDGRAKTLRALLTEDHAAQDVAGEGPLADTEIDDLIEFLKSL